MTQIHMTGATHEGRVRDRNEDAWTCDERLGLAGVADGMGGHRAGHVASRLAVDAVLDFFEGRGPGAESPADSSGGADRSSEESGDDPGERMAEAVRSANERILIRGEKHPEERGMGTTLTILRVDETTSRYVIGHVGDSRAYLLRDRSLTPLTRDHTPLQERVDAGHMTREEARVHPMGHVLSQALGTQSRVSPQVVEGDLRPGDLFLLSSDGLTAALSEDRIQEMLVESFAGGEARSGAPSRARTRSTAEAVSRLDSVAEELVEAVLDEGAPDNVTVVLLEVAEGG